MVFWEIKIIGITLETGLMEESSRKREGEAGASAPEASAGSHHGIEETFPDMLKNTHSNIMRLTVEIQQCEGRQKYLAQTRSPSDGGDVRWYFCKVPLADNGEFLVQFGAYVFGV